ncbi:DNA topoisomerase IB [Pollutibacter soli]|uniref:DNA topoisomerase IB n=1 Tax=Pollutibacter soli TaxID=3034157 RepID=UPI0030141790
MKTIRSISHKQYVAIHKDPKKSADLADLKYVTEGEKGISRIKKANGFQYYYKGKTVKDENTLMRIKKLAIPPSWTDVWICNSAGGHIQATGKDLNGRKQYRYHANWNSLRNDTKFHKLIEFGKALPLLRRRIRRDLRNKDLNAEKVIAAAISTMEETSIRIGNAGYEKLYGSYGLTTLKDQHVDIKSESADFVFKGKKGISHRLKLKNRQLVKIIRQCRDIPGKNLFQYFGEDGSRRTIDSGMVNNYIKEAGQGDFSAKDFRTWTGTVKALESFCCMDEAHTESTVKKNVLSVLDDVSKKLGNSRSVCRKYYVHPKLIQLYEEGKLMSYVQKLSCKEAGTLAGLQKNEKVLMKILSKM